MQQGGSGVLERKPSGFRDGALGSDEISPGRDLAENTDPVEMALIEIHAGAQVPGARSGRACCTSALAMWTAVATSSLLEPERAG